MWPSKRVPSTIRRALMTVLASSLVTLGLLGDVSLGRAATVPDPWRTGQYREFAPDAPAFRTVTGTSDRPLDPGLRLEQTAVQRPRLGPGDSAAFRAQYRVVAPTGALEVKETRVVRFNGATLARLVKAFTRPSGPVGSEYRLRVPPDAAEGWYTVTTIIEAARPGTGSARAAEAHATFFVEAKPSGVSGPPPGPGATVAGRPSGAGKDSLTVDLSADKKVYRPGDALTLRFTTSQDGYLTLVNVGTSGKITILFPNRFSGGNKVEKGKLHVIPSDQDAYTLTLEGPPGTELVYALLTLKPVAFVESDFSRAPRSQIFQSVSENAVAFTRDINAVAKTTPLAEQAKAVLELEVAP